VLLQPLLLHRPPAHRLVLLQPLLLHRPPAHRLVLLLPLLLHRLPAHRLVLLLPLLLHRLPAHRLVLLQPLLLHRTPARRPFTDIGIGTKALLTRPPFAARRSGTVRSQLRLATEPNADAQFRSDNGRLFETGKP